MWRSVRPVAAVAAVALMFGACDESLESSIGCPSLCPQQLTTVRDTTFFAIVLDTTLGGFPPIGTEDEMLLAARGDTLDARGIIRYDSLVTTFHFRNVASDSLITTVDSTGIKFRVASIDTTGPPITISLYDVNTPSGDDTTTALLAPLFTAARLLGSRTFAPESIKDSMTVPIDASKLLAKITSTDSIKSLRVGVQLTAPRSAQMSVYTANAGFTPILFYRPSPDSTADRIQLPVKSMTPTTGFIRGDVADFQIIVKGPTDPPAGVIRVGGTPGHRVYLKFDVPKRILDSTTVIRASLQLTQKPLPNSPGPKDTLALRPFEITAGAPVTDIARALLFLSTRLGLDTVRLVPADSGLREFEVLNLLRSWKGTTEAKTPRVLALRSEKEGTRGTTIDFFSNEAVNSVRPRLRITYVPQLSAGIP